MVSKVNRLLFLKFDVDSFNDSYTFFFFFLIINWCDLKQAQLLFGVDDLNVCLVDNNIFCKKKFLAMMASALVSLFIKFKNLLVLKASTFGIL